MNTAKQECSTAKQIAVYGTNPFKIQVLNEYKSINSSSLADKLKLNISSFEISSKLHKTNITKQQTKTVVSGFILILSRKNKKHDSIILNYLSFDVTNTVLTQDISNLQFV